MRGSTLWTLILSSIAFLVVTLIASRFPLLGTAGPESAQIAALAGGIALFFAGIARGVERRNTGYSADARFQMLLMLGYLLLFVTVTAINGWRTPTCQNNRTHAYLLLLTLPVFFLHSNTGLLLGRLTGRMWLGLLLGFAVLLGLAGWQVVDWYYEPSMHIVVSHYFGIIDETLTGGANAQVTGSILAFRSATAVLALVLFCIGLGLYPKQGQGRLSGPTLLPFSLYYPLAGVLAVVFLLLHYPSRAAIAPRHEDLVEQYSLTRQRGNLIVHADPALLTVREVDAILADGTLWLERLQERLGIQPSQPIEVWLHANAQERAKLTGSTGADFALPWRHELHIANANVPHPTLGHEIAHVLAGELNTSTFHLPTQYGLLYNPGIVEGLAMALTPELSVQGNLTLLEQAAAMRQAGFSPPLTQLFSPSFWLENQSRAYVTAGALLEMMLADHAGTEVNPKISALYQTGDLQSAFVSEEEMQKFIDNFYKTLDQTPLFADASTYAQMRFSKPSILDETCDAGAKERARNIRNEARSGRYSQAVSMAEQYENPLTRKTILSIAGDAMGLQDYQIALQYLQKARNTGTGSNTNTNNPHTDPHGAAGAAVTTGTTGTTGANSWHIKNMDTYELASIEELIGDVYALNQQWPEAQETWKSIHEKALDDPFDVGRQRQLMAKVLLSSPCESALPCQAAHAALAFLLHTDSPAQQPAYLAQLAEAINMALIGDDHSLHTNLSRYILARQYVQQGLFADAQPHISALKAQIDAGNPISELFTAQIDVMQAAIWIRMGEAELAETLLTRLVGQSNRPALRLKLRDWSTRAKRIQAGIKSPRTDPASGDRWLLGYDNGMGLP